MKYPEMSAFIDRRVAVGFAGAKLGVTGMGENAPCWFFEGTTKEFGKLTVAELIAELETCPQDAVVVVHAAGRGPTGDVEYTHEMATSVFESDCSVCSLGPHVMVE